MYLKIKCFFSDVWHVFCTSVIKINKMMDKEVFKQHSLREEAKNSCVDEIPEDEHPQPEEVIEEGEKEFQFEIYPPCAVAKASKRLPIRMSPRQWLDRTSLSDSLWDHFTKRARRPIEVENPDGSKTYLYKGGEGKYVPKYDGTQDFFKNLKIKKFDTIVAMTSDESVKQPTLATINQWNHLYLIDYDGHWSGDLASLEACLWELYETLPNACLIGPSTRSGIHIVIYSSSETFDVEEYITYAMIGYNIIKDYFVFNEEDIEEQICDGHFLSNHKQLFVMNTMFLFGKHMLCVRDYGYARDYPKPFDYNKWQSLKKELDSDLFKKILERLTYQKEVESEYSQQPTRIYENAKSSKIVQGNDSRFSINKDFCIAGVPYRGNDLRWRIVKIIRDYLPLPEDKKDAKVAEILKSHFTNSDEMLRTLDTVKAYTYPSNRLLSIWVLQNILKPSISYTHSIELGDTAYLSDYLDNILLALERGPVYLASSPGTGKTEWAKKLLEKLDKVIIVLHQNSIKDSKFADSQYAYDPARVKELFKSDCDTPPSKMVLVWDQFVRVYKNFSGGEYNNWSEYTFIFDESHNLVTQLGFRGIIFKLSRIIPSLNRVVLMTGTPVGEDCLLSSKLLTSYKFTKSQKTQYTFYPVRLFCGDKDIEKKERQYVIDYINRGNYDLAVIYDNYTHKKWAEELPQYVHYVEPEKGAADVVEINKLQGTKKLGIICTCFMGEGIDITSKLRAIDKVIVAVNVDRFMNPHELEQIIHRFRDAKAVDVLICSHSDKVARPQYARADTEDQDVLATYVYDCSYNTRQRSYLYDALLNVPTGELTQKDYEMLNDRGSLVNSLLEVNKMMAQAPLTLYTVPFMQTYSSQYIVKNIKEIDVTSQPFEKKRKSHNQGFDQWIKTNISQLISRLRSDNDVTSLVDKYDGKFEGVSRVQLRDSLTSLLTLNEWSVLEDCVKYFQNKDGSIGWRKMSSFIHCVEKRDRQSVNFYDTGIEQSSKRTRDSFEQDEMRVEQLEKMLDFQLQPNVCFKDLVAEYKWGSTETIILLPNGGLTKKASTLQSKSIFKMSKYKKVASNTKPITIRNKQTGESYNFDSKKDCQEKMQWGRVNVDNLIAGKGKLAKDWEVIE